MRPVTMDGDNWRDELLPLVALRYLLARRKQAFISSFR